MRASWLALVMLCVVLKPSIGLAGELHRSFHGEAELLHQRTATDSLPVSAAVAGDDESDGGWHKLMHVDFCCGIAALLPRVATIGVVLESLAPIDPMALAILPSPTGNPFRPPICR